MSKSPKIASMLLAVAGLVLIVAGAFTWYTVSDELAAQRITVADDAGCQASQKVNGPLEAYCQAEIISHHAMQATGGKTYAELAQDDPKRQTAMTASFLQASLYTSVVAFGVAAFAMGVGILSLLTAWGIRGANKNATKAAALAPTTTS